MAGAVALEAVVLLGFTYLSAPRSATVGTGAVTWLQANLGSYRFATLGPIQPNYGSYFGIAEMNANELPLPKAWTDYVARDLDSNIIPFEFTGGYRSDPAGPSPAEELTTLVANYEAVGVRYVVVPASGTDPTGAPYPAPGSPPWPAGPRLVYHGDEARRCLSADRPPRFHRDGVSDGVAYHARQIRLGQVERGCAIEPGQFEQLSDEGAHPLCLLLDPAHRAG